MINYDNDLLQLQENVALKHQLETKLNDLNTQRSVFEQKVAQLRNAHHCEQKDVQKLEGRSLANYFYQAIGKLDDKLTEERREAAAAKVKLDAAERELAAIDYEIQQIQEKLQSLHGCEQIYAAALEEKRNALKSSGTPAATQILELEEKIAFLHSQRKEIREAIAAGHSAIGTADSVLSELDDADSWNTWDMFGGGGIITHMAKHSHLDEAQEKVEQLQNKLRRFKTELADIDIHADIQVSIDGFLRFADYFFDGLFADWAVGERISESQSSVRKVKDQVRSALKKLEGMEKAADAQIRSLEEKIEEAVIQS